MPPPAAGSLLNCKDSPLATPENLASLDSLLVHAIRRGASDLLLIAGAPVTLRVGGVLSPAAGRAAQRRRTRGICCCR